MSATSSSSSLLVTSGSRSRSVLMVRLVGVVHHMSHLMPQVAEDVGSVETLHMAHALGVERGQVRASQVEGDGDRHCLEGNPPLGGEIEAWPDPGDTSLPQLLRELGQDRLQTGALDGESQVPDRRGPEVGLVKAG